MRSSRELAGRFQSLMPTRKRAKYNKLPEDVLKAIDESHKIHGDGLMIPASKVPLCNSIPTGCFILDFALLGGFPEGYSTMSYGYHSTGKSTHYLKAVAKFQEKHPDKVVGWIDAEGLFDSSWAAKMGVDIDRMMVGRPEYGEQAVDIMDDWMKIDSVSLVVLDSIPACVPMKVLDNSAEDDTMAALPRLMGKMCSKMTSNNTAGRKKGKWTSVWLVNQFRNKVGFVLGSPLTLPGGVQINHNPTTKLWFKLKKEHMGKDRNSIDVTDFNEQAFKIEKNKHGSSIKEGEFQFYLNPDNDKGLPIGSYDNVPALMTFGKKMGFIKGGGASWRLLTGIEPTTKYGRLSEIEEYLYANREEEDTLARSIIANQRTIKGIPALPPDGYLVSTLGRLVSLSDEVTEKN